MNRRRTHALTLTEVVVVLGIILFLVMLFVLMYPSVRHRGGLSPRTICAANLKGIGNGLATYATCNNDWFPVPAHVAAATDEMGSVRYAPGVIGTKRGVATSQDAGRSTEQDAVLSTTRVFWELVRNGSASPKSFFCPSSADVPNDEDDPQVYWDFRKYTEISYGFQVPFGKLGVPMPNCDQDMALAADKGPYSAALEAGASNPGVPTAKVDGSPDGWRKWNSPNHGGQGNGEGQNVLYPDGYVDFSLTPLAGCEKDNIYTRWSQADASKQENVLARIHGTPPTGIETPWGETDSLIYP